MEKRTLHSVRIRDDLWVVLQPFLEGDGYHNSFQEFVEKCIIEKAGLDNIEIEVSKTEQEIERLQKLNSERKEILKNQRKENPLEDMRIKNLRDLLKKSYRTFTKANKDFAIQAGKFKDWREAEVWIRNHQGSQIESED